MTWPVRGAGLNAFEQAYILDCDHRLVSKGRNQFDLFVGERPHLFVVNMVMTPIRVAFPQQWHARRAATLT